MSLKKTVYALLPLLLACGSFAPSPAVAQRGGASAEGARAVLARLAELSRRQAIQTEAARKLLTGEMLELNIPSFGNLSEAPDKVLLLEKNSAVGRFQLSGENGQVTDVYFYLQHDGGWKVSAVRLLSLTGIIEQVYLGLKARPALTEEERALFENYRLTLAPDKELKAWFAANSGTLDELCALLRARGNGRAAGVSRGDEKFPDAAALLRRLNLSAARVEADGDVEIVIGGVTDNTVGFINSPSQSPPKISPSSYIWVEEVAAGWYLFRTT